MEEDAGPQVEGDGESVAADVPGFGERGLRGEGCGTVLGPVAGQRIEDESEADSAQAAVSSSESA